jgi:Peptide N-acetyl-beta-D-glucosaminyl asparaginase amidase A
VTSRGRQFDRLGLVYLGDTEVFRTSTAEPTWGGIEWTYIKDMSNYLSLLKTSQKIIFDLGNLIDDTYTAPFNATLTATFFTSESTVTPADIILPISARLSSANKPSAFSIPSQNASTTYVFPRNVRRAVATISSCGQADEEFWFGNVLSSDIDAFPSSGAPLFGYSPFREVQLYIDGNLAGVEWPFPIIFTGGVVPGLWRPIVGIDAFDLREHEIDITPWLPLLCDGASDGHTFEIRVAGIDDDGYGHGALSKTVANYWIVTGKIFLWLDVPGWVTKGSTPTAVNPKPHFELSSSVELNLAKANESLTYTVNVTRELSVSSIVITSEGLFAASWDQSLAYSNAGRFTAKGNIQLTKQNTKGLDASSGGYSRAYSYPVWVNTSYSFESTSGNFTIDANISRGLNLETWGTPVFPTGLHYSAFPPSAKSHISYLTGSALHTTQNGSAHYEAAPALRLALGHGTTEQDFTFTGLHASAPSTKAGYELYHRHVLAINGTVVKDNETIVGEAIIDYSLPASFVGDRSRGERFADESVRSILGRGPG